jgi:phosphoribosylaminoimidazolecarboxamide formyltransferase / IMP cyclohydrolase
MTIRRALLSVSDKTSLLELARALANRGVELLSTGGTARTLTTAGIAVSSVESYTGSPEVMDGRVKTLHPRIHGGLLAREGIDDDALASLGGKAIDLVVVNLYPFEQTLRRGDASFDELVEQIDIGGPSLLRAAAKNHARVSVLCDPNDYSLLLAELEQRGAVSAETRRFLAGKAFAHTATYDAAIAGWLSLQGETDGAPRHAFLCLEKAYALRYGENPHQRATFYRQVGAAPGTLARAESLGEGAKELSFNNLVDAEAALDAVRDFTEPAAVIIKHATPCGIATTQQLASAYRAAREADPLSAFGGIAGFNREVDLETARAVTETFMEALIAPSFSAEALTVLRQKKNLRLLALGTWLPAEYPAATLRPVSGGLLLQDRDSTGPSEVARGRVVSKRAPSDAERAALAFAWVACKHVRSNAIVLARPCPGGYATVGIGGGQTARVSAVRQATSLAKERASGAVLASDAFFPFPDGIQAAAAQGVTAIVQPGGSKADTEVIAAADEANLAMVFTGVRHFRH